MSNSIDPSLLERKIIHFDMDAFYASIEIRDDPSLVGKPVVVGGSPQSRGVVSTASYEARKYGIRSAMPCSHAARLCPKAVFIRPNFSKYSEASHKIREIFRKYTPLVEPLSLDEAYLDVTENHMGLYAVKVAKLIQEEVYETTKLTGSAGIAPNKLVAKIASDFHKPRGITVVLPGQVLDFMESLPLRKIHGIGPVTDQRLSALGLKFCRDVWRYSLEDLGSLVGSMATWLYHGSRGIDHRPIETSWVRKSMGREQTFGKDILDVGQLKDELASIVDDVVEDLGNDKITGRTITLKVRYDDFTRVTRSQTLAESTGDRDLIYNVGSQLLNATEAGSRRIRLLGVALSNLQ